MRYKRQKIGQNHSIAKEIQERFKLPNQYSCPFVARTPGLLGTNHTNLLKSLKPVETVL